MKKSKQVLRRYDKQSREGKKNAIIEQKEAKKKENLPTKYTTS